MRQHPIFFCDGVVFSVVPWYEYTTWPMPGVYMLCRREADGRRAVLYIGESGNMADRLGPGHEHWQEALALGMDEVLVHVVAKTPAARLAVETHLRQLYRPPLNRQGIGALAEALARPVAPTPRRGFGLGGLFSGAPVAPPTTGRFSSLADAFVGGPPRTALQSTVAHPAPLTLGSAFRKL